MFDNDKSHTALNSWQKLLNRLPFGHHFTTTNLWQLIRYGTVTAISYVVLFVSMYLIVESGISASWAYPVVLGLMYIGVYISYVKFVFRVTPSRANIIRFIGVLIGSWIASNILFWILHELYTIHYMIAMIANIFILGGFRFILQKFFVFKSHV